MPSPHVSPSPPAKDAQIVIYGANRRGSHEIVAIPSCDFRGTYSKVGDVGITSEASTGGSVVYGTESLTERGDAGLFTLIP